MGSNLPGIKMVFVTGGKKPSSPRPLRKLDAVLEELDALVFDAQTGRAPPRARPFFAYPDRSGSLAMFAAMRFAS
jgi:hypothetical protein